jgi:hypothetical protein
MLAPREFLPLPSDFPNAEAHAAMLRYLLVAAAFLWAWLAARERYRAAFAVATLFVEVAIGFWVACLQRPYGLFAGTAETRRAAEVSVSAASGSGASSFVAGEAPLHPGWLGLLRTGIEPEALIVLPTLLPLASVAVVGAAVFWVWSCRAEAPLAAFLWLAFSTGELDVMRGAGFVSESWSHPEGSLLLPALTTSVLLVGRLRGRAAVLIAAVLAGSCALAPGSGAALSVPDALLLLTVDQGAWLPLWLLSLKRRGADAASTGLVCGGSAAVIAASVWRAGVHDAWAGHALYRLGLLLGAARFLASAAPAIGSWMRDRWPSALTKYAPAGLAHAALIVVAVPGSFLVTWEPLRLDPLARASLEPISPSLRPAMSWIRDNTPPDAVFLASRDYAPAIAVLAGRRLLRAPGFAQTADDGARARTEGAILAGRPLPFANDYGVRFVFAAPGDFRERGLTRPEQLEARAGLTRRYVDAHSFHVYARQR